MDISLNNNRHWYGVSKVWHTSNFSLSFRFLFVSPVGRNSFVISDLSNSLQLISFISIFAMQWGKSTRRRKKRTSQDLKLFWTTKQPKERIPSTHLKIKTNLLHVVQQIYLIQWISFYSNFHYVDSTSSSQVNACSFAHRFDNHLVDAHTIFLIL